MTSITTSHTVRLGRIRTIGGGLSLPERLSAAVLLLLMLAVAAARWLAPYPPTHQDFEAGVLLPPGSPGHLLGTDQLGRDLLARLLVGAQASFGIALFAVLLGLAVGGTLGMLAGYRGGWVDAVIMRVVDSLMAFPTLVLALVIAAGLGPSFRSTVLAISLVMVPNFARLTRTLVMQEREREYVQAMRITGASFPRIARLHLAPNIAGPILASAAISFGHAIPGEAALSFLGLGVQLPSPSWGNMIAEGYGFISLSPWGIVLPAVLIAVTVGAVSILTDGLRRFTADGE
jgi:ABC-type dipeptide/oligopeptide/nickel transport system permease subunit